MGDVVVWWKIEGVNRIFDRRFPANVTWNRVVEYINKNCFGDGQHPGTSAIYLKPFGAKEEDDEVDYGQEVGDGEAPKTSKTQPLQVTFTPTAQPVANSDTQLASLVEGAMRPLFRELIPPLLRELDKERSQVSLSSVKTADLRRIQNGTNVDDVRWVDMRVLLTDGNLIAQPPAFVWPFDDEVKSREGPSGYVQHLRKNLKLPPGWYLTDHAVSLATGETFPRLTGHCDVLAFPTVTSSSDVNLAMMAFELKLPSTKSRKVAPHLDSSCINQARATLYALSANAGQRPAFVVLTDLQDSWTAHFFVNNERGKLSLVTAASDDRAVAYTFIAAAANQLEAFQAKGDFWNKAGASGDSDSSGNGNDGGNQGGNAPNGDGRRSSTRNRADASFRLETSFAALSFSASGGPSKDDYIADLVGEDLLDEDELRAYRVNQVYSYFSRLEEMRTITISG